MEKTEKRVLTLDRYEHSVVVNALNEIYYLLNYNLTCFQLDSLILNRQ